MFGASPMPKENSGGWYRASGEVQAASGCRKLLMNVRWLSNSRWT